MFCRQQLLYTALVVKTTLSLFGYLPPEMVHCVCIFSYCRKACRRAGEFLYTSTQYYLETSIDHYRKGRIRNRQKSMKKQTIRNFDMIFLINNMKLDDSQNLIFFNISEGLQIDDQTWR